MHGTRREGNAMKKGGSRWNQLSSILILGILVLLAGCKGAQERPQGILIEGVVVEKDGLAALKGYKFERVKGNTKDDESVVLRHIGTGQIQGTFDCTCAAGGGTGGCKIISFPDQLNCRPSVCTECALIITIEDAGLAVVLKASLRVPCNKPSKTELPI